jgi:DNA invertase Pin-like site-specific DNA recombinase
MNELNHMNQLSFSFLNNIQRRLGHDATKRKTKEPVQLVQSARTERRSVEVQVAALYARTSTGHQNHDLQLDELRQVAASRGMHVVEYVDQGSGKSGAKLPERERLMDDARCGRISLVMVWRFDRFARSTSDLLNALGSFDAWGVDFVSLREGVDTTTPTGRLVFTIIGAIAEFERSLIRERVMAGIETARRKGVQLGRPRTSVSVDRAIAMLQEGMSVRTVARKMGVSPRTLRRRLHALGQKPPQIRDSETTGIIESSGTDSGSGETN